METNRKSHIPRTPLTRPGMNNRLLLTSAQQASRTAESRFSMIGFRMSTAPRASLAADSMSGRPSTFAPVGENVRRILPIPRPVQKDCRAMTDRARQTEMVAHVLDFLRHREVPFSFSEKWLRTISKADFKMLVEYMLRQLDEKFAINKLEEDVPKIFAALGYPYSNLKPSTMVTVGAQHSWSHVITALDWLVDVVECDNNLGEEELGKEESLAYSYFTSCYKKLMNATNPADNDFTDELNVFRQLINGDMDIQTQISEQCFQRIENEKMIQVLKEETETEQQIIRDTEVCIHNFEADIDAMQKFIRSLKASSALLDQNLECSEIELQKLRDALKELEKECANKEALISIQKMSGEEARALQIKRNSLRENLVAMRKEVSDGESKQFNLQPQVFRVLHQIRGEYRAILAGVQELLPGDSFEHFDFAKLDFDEVWRAFAAGNNSKSELNKLVDGAKQALNDGIGKYRCEKRQLGIKALEAEREMRDVETNMATASKEEKLTMEQVARDVEDSSKVVERKQYELDMVQTQRERATNEAQQLNNRCRGLRDRLAEKEKQYLYQKNELEKSYNDIVAVVCDKMVLLTSKMEEIAARKQMWKDLAESILASRNCN